MKQEMSVIGIDIAQCVFHLVGMDARGQIVLRTRCSRGEVLPLMANLGPVTLEMVGTPDKITLPGLAGNGRV